MVHRRRRFSRLRRVLALVTKHRFTAFRHDNFEPTDVRLVVTDCDQETRTVPANSTPPAAREYAESSRPRPRNSIP